MNGLLHVLAAIGALLGLWVAGSYAMLGLWIAVVTIGGRLDDDDAP